MRTGRERLTEWVEDIIYAATHGLHTPVEEWVDCIMEDINIGIIEKED